MNVSPERIALQLQGAEVLQQIDSVFTSACKGSAENDMLKHLQTRIERGLRNTDSTFTFADVFTISDVAAIPFSCPNITDDAMRLVRQIRGSKQAACTWF